MYTSAFLEWTVFGTFRTRADTEAVLFTKLRGETVWKVAWADDKTSHFSARGKYGQYIYVAPERDLVIVRLGKEEGERGYGYWIELFEELVTKLEVSAKKSR